ncbi:MAG: hypothetical protein ACHQX3_03750 [Nitrospirales bacterium]
MDKTQATVIALALAIVETVDEVEPHGAPGGVLYVALAETGITLDSFLIFMSSLVRIGHLTKKGELYFITERGRKLIAEAKALKKTVEKAA